MDDPPHTVWAHHSEVAFFLTLVFALVVFLYCLPAVLPGGFNGHTPGHVMCSARLVRLDGKSVVAEGAPRKAAVKKNNAEVQGLISSAWASASFLYMFFLPAVIFPFKN